MNITCLGSKGNNNIFDFNNISKSTNYVDNLLNKAYDSMPWLKKHKSDVKDLKIDTENSFIIIPFHKDDKIKYVTSLALNLEWNKAVSHLNDLLYYSNKPTYDFLIGDIPVKIFGNYVQIGHEIIPTFTKSNFFDKYNDDLKLDLYLLALAINNIIA